MPAPLDTAIIENEKYSVREFAPGVWGGYIGDGMGILWPGQQGLISGWGTWRCDRDLRMFYYFLHNTLIQGTVDLICQNILSTPYEISGGRNQTYQWQDLFFEAEFGEGYDTLLWKFLQDYYTLNRGGFMELVSYGDPSTPLKPGARILGINHLDAMRIVLTDNLDIPYQYYSEYTGKLHNLHRSRVIHLVHAPSPNTNYPHYGKSPLYNVLSQSNAQILLGRHQSELLSDLPPPGLVIFNNVKADNVEQAMRTFESERRSDGQVVHRGPLKIEGLKPNEPVSVTFVPLASVPQDFDYEKYMRMHVNLVALGFQVDPQDIWPLSGQGLGTGIQSKILASKASGKGRGYMLTRLERVWNNTMPRSVEWKYKAQNAEEGREQAEIAKVWVDTANAATDLSTIERRQLMANQIPQFADVLLDEQGNVRLPDDDPKEPGQETVNANEEVMADDVTEAAPPGQAPPDEQVTADDSTPLEKEYDATASEFEGEIAAILSDAADGSINKTSFSARMRSAINKYGRLAMLDGLNAGGVETDELDTDDKTTLATLLAAQSPYVSNVANEIFNSDGGFKGSPDFRASLWVAKTLEPFYYAGLQSADQNGMYKFVGTDGDESCSTCKKLKGQVHRLKDWVRKKLVPRVDTENFECGGWQCQHYLEKTDEKAQGNWKAASMFRRMGLLAA